MYTDVEKFNSHVYCTPPMTDVYGVCFVAEYLGASMESLDTLKPWLWFQLKDALPGHCLFQQDGVSLYFY
jgi:hypothetical protein